MLKKIISYVIIFAFLFQDVAFCMEEFLGDGEHSARTSFRKKDLCGSQGSIQGDDESSGEDEPGEEEPLLSPLSSGVGFIGDDDSSALPANQRSILELGDLSAPHDKNLRKEVPPHIQFLKRLEFTSDDFESDEIEALESILGLKEPGKIILFGRI